MEKVSIYDEIDFMRQCSDENLMLLHDIIDEYFYNTDEASRNIEFERYKALINIFERDYVRIVDRLESLIKNLENRTEENNKKKVDL